MPVVRLCTPSKSSMRIRPKVLTCFDGTRAQCGLAGRVHIIEGAGVQQTRCKQIPHVGTRDKLIAQGCVSEREERRRVWVGQRCSCVGNGMLYDGLGLYSV